MSQAFSGICPDPTNGGDVTALVVVVSRPVDLQRALQERWYRIPVNRAPNRAAAECLAFYQTGAFAPDERYLIRWVAPVRGCFLATRCELIPEEPRHPRADEQYYKVLLGDPVPLPHPIPSRRLRRITFIPTTLGRLHQAKEINDLWLKTTAQQRLWEAIRQIGLDGESQYPLPDGPPGCVADFALFCRAGRIAVIMTETLRAAEKLGEGREEVLNYLTSTARWHLFQVESAQVEQDPMGCGRRLAALVAEMGGLVDPPRKESLHT